MSDNEKLIEEVRKAVAGVMWPLRGVMAVASGGDELGADLAFGSTVEAVARVALAVFEKAHTPTNKLIACCRTDAPCQKHREAQHQEVPKPTDNEHQGATVERIIERDTPTDDEREALAALIDPDSYRAGWSAEAHDVRDQLNGLYIKRGVYRTVDRILAAGFRRSEVPEPSERRYVGWSESQKSPVERHDLVMPIYDEPEPLIECPHWSEGKITLRKGCTACAAVTEQGDRGI